jgi:hypothetical protein
MRRVECAAHSTSDSRWNPTRRTQRNCAPRLADQTSVLEHAHSTQGHTNHASSQHMRKRTTKIESEQRVSRKGRSILKFHGLDTSTRLHSESSTLDLLQPQQQEKKNRHTTIASPVRHSSEGGIKEMETETNTDPARCEPRRAATGQRRPQPTLLSRPQGQGGRLAGGYPA